MAGTAPIRVGVVLAPRSVRAWHRLAVEAMCAVEGVTLAAVVVDGRAPAVAAGELPADAALLPIAIDEVARGRPRVSVDLRVATRERLDVVVDFAGLDEGDRIEAPRFGVWRYGFGDGRAFADGAAGTIVRLYRTTCDPRSAVVLNEGWYRARTPEAWGTQSVATRVAPWCARALRQMAGGDMRALTRRATPTAGCLDLEPPDRYLSRSTAVADVLRDWLRRDRWTIGLVARPIRDILESGALDEPTWLRNQPGDRFYADPFPVACDSSGVRVLVEDYRYRSGRKGLTELAVDRQGTVQRATEQETLPRPASYPFLLRRENELRCIPETSGARAATTFARNGPQGEWSRRGDLVQGFPVVDPTLVEWDGAWWLFCTKQGDEDQTELHLFQAPTCDGPWQPHPLNPVKSDTRSSRPAGACFVVDGALYRPAQNCSSRYGAGVTINRVMDLGPDRFREEPALTLRPADGSAWPDGLHTINSLDGVTVVDGLRVERRW